MTFEVLVVCSANVCRSPMAATVLERVCTEADLSETIRVSTCGENASGGREVCEQIGIGVLTENETDELRGHKPVQLTKQMVVDSDLVLVTDRSIRAAVVRMSPGAHPRTFTIREAASLAAYVGVNVTANVASITEPVTPETSLDWFVLEMHESRGLSDLPGRRKHRRTGQPWQTFWVHDHDIPDAHRDPVAPHKLVQELVVDSTSDLAKALVRICG